MPCCLMAALWQCYGAGHITPPCSPPCASLPPPRLWALPLQQPPPAEFLLVLLVGLRQVLVFISGKRKLPWVFVAVLELGEAWGHPPFLLPSCASQRRGKNKPVSTFRIVTHLCRLEQDQVWGKLKQFGGKPSSAARARLWVLAGQGCVSMELEQAPSSRGRTPAQRDGDGARGAHPCGTAPSLERSWELSPSCPVGGNLLDRGR